MKISSCCFSAIGLWYIRRPENARDPRATLEEHTSTVMDYINYHVDSVISRKLIRKSAQPTLVNSCATLAEELNYFDRDSRDQMVQAPSPEQYKVTTHQKQNQRNIRSIVSLSLSSPCVPADFKTSTMIPVHKQSADPCQSDYRPDVLTPLSAKRLERLVMKHMRSIRPASFD